MVKKILLVALGALAVSGIVVLANIKNDNIDSTDKIFEAQEMTGEIGEKIIGDMNTAKLVVYEYADYGCAHCAEWNRKMNDLIKKYDGKLAVVFRSYNLGFNNGEMAARAATAAQLQGYFDEYKDLLFNNQAEWIYTEEDVLDLFVSYFEQASDGQGDTPKFMEDIKSTNVRKRNNFENRMGTKSGLRGTPMFRIDGEMVSLDKLVETIKNKLR